MRLPFDEAQRAVLEERARRLARRPEPGPPPEATLTLVGFRAGGERYAIEARYVREAIPHATLFPLPGAPPRLAGVTEIRGDVLPVFDPRCALAPDAPALRTAGATGESAALVVLAGEGAPDMALAADELDRVFDLAKDALVGVGASAGAGPSARALVLGAMPDGLIVLDGAAMLVDSRFVIATRDENGEPNGRENEEKNDAGN